MDPFAYARSVAERWPIINQDTHVLLAGVDSAAQSVDWVARGIVAHRDRADVSLENSDGSRKSLYVSILTVSLVGVVRLEFVETGRTEAA